MCVGYIFFISFVISYMNQKKAAHLVYKNKASKQTKTQMTLIAEDIFAVIKYLARLDGLHSDV